MKEISSSSFPCGFLKANCQCGLEYIIGLSLAKKTDLNPSPLFPMCIPLVFVDSEQLHNDFTFFALNSNKGEMGGFLYIQYFHLDNKI